MLKFSTCIDLGDAGRMGYDRVGVCVSGECLMHLPHAMQGRSLWANAG